VAVVRPATPPPTTRIVSTFAIFDSARGEPDL
jgi:hypothetical protein